LDLRPGEQRSNVQIAGSGRTIIAHVTVPAELKARGLIPTYAMLTLARPDFVRPDNWDSLNLDEQRRRRAEFEKGAPYQQYARSVQEFAAPLGPDGLVRIDDVPAGQYVLLVEVQRPTPGNPTYWRWEATAERAVDVPEMTGGRSDQSLDVGSLELKAHHYLQKGDPAPAFVANAFDGKPVNLADLRGKYVLLDFWATWCGPCVAAIPHLQRLHETYGADPRFVMISISVDDRQPAPAAFLAKRNLPWLQVFAGRTSTASAWPTFGLQGLPSVWLIGPDGQILAREIADEEIDQQLKTALKHE
jgi:thiol-disulfide isomerase/thioredoxin